MRISFIDTSTDSEVFVTASKIEYSHEYNKVFIVRENFVYKSCAIISYDEYKEMTENLLAYGYLDLSNNSFDCCDTIYI